MSGEAAWLSEAVVEFLKGPMYINPLMSFIDEKCLIFTPEEENKLEYTIYHNDFKELVDSLLTEFLEDLGVGAEQFYQIVGSAQGSDQLTSFVVQTILTVDDFLMFKSMMVRRNIDLTNQVLEAVEEMRRMGVDAASGGKGQRPTSSGGGGGGGGGGGKGVAASGPSLSSKAAPTAEEEEALKEAMALSNRLAAEWSETDRLTKAMRVLQFEDEDVAYPVAIAASLRDQARFDSELADIEQAIALSLALEEERRRMAAQQAAAGAAGGATAASSAAARPGSASGAAGAAAAAKPAGAAAAAAGAKPAASTAAAPAAAAARPPSASGAAPAAAARPPSASGAAPAAAAARPPSASGAAPAAAAAAGVKPGAAAGESHPVIARAAPAAPSLAPLRGHLPSDAMPPLPPPSSAAAADPAPRPPRFTPAPIDAPTGYAGVMGKSTSMRNRGAGYKAEASGVDMEAIRKAAQQAAESQKKHMGKGDITDAASQWLQEAKKKLIAQKQAEREQEMADYKSVAGAGKAKPAPAPGSAGNEAKRAALREALAQKMKQNIMAAQS